MIRFSDLTDEEVTYLVDEIRRQRRYIEASEQKSKTRHCKDCKYFEYDSVAKVDGIPLIVAHEICSRWG